MGRMKELIDETCGERDVTPPEQRAAIGMAAKAAGVVDCKPEYSYLPKSFMDQVSFVMMAGAMKYAKDNYRKGHNILQLTSAAARHLKLIESGEDIDEDTSRRLKYGCTSWDGKHTAGYGVAAPDIYHWACVAACALMAIEQMKLGTIKDDRWKSEGDKA